MTKPLTPRQKRIKAALTKLEITRNREKLKIESVRAKAEAKSWNKYHKRRMALLNTFRQPKCLTKERYGWH